MWWEVNINVFFLFFFVQKNAENMLPSPALNIIIYPSVALETWNCVFVHIDVWFDFFKERVSLGHDHNSMKGKKRWWLLEVLARSKKRINIDKYYYEAETCQCCADQSVASFIHIWSQDFSFLPQSWCDISIMEWSNIFFLVQLC